MAGKKKGAKKAASAPASRSSASAESTQGEKAVASGRLHRAVWHKGRMYDPKKRGDAQAFADAIKKEKDGAKHAQKLADKGVVSGFGTRGKGRKADEDAEDLAGESDAGDAIGGGVEGDEEATDDEEQE